jgi:succinoglycan biosynthesis transport protein ExoP
MNVSDHSLPSGQMSGVHHAASRSAVDTYEPDEFWDDEPQEAALDLRAIWAALYLNRYIMLAVVAAALLLGVVATLLTPPTYRARASIQIDQQSAKVLGTEDTEPFAAGAEADRFLQTQVDVLKSRALAAKVADALHLFGNQAFLAGMGVRAPNERETEANRRDDVLDVLQRHLQVDLPHNSRVVGISVDSRDPAVAASVANSYAENFIANNIQRRFDTSAYSREFLQSQLAQTKTRLEGSERALIDYSRSARLIDASNGVGTNGQEQGPRSLTTSNLIQLNTALASARSGRVQAEQRWREVQQTPLMSLPEVLSNPAIQQMTQHRGDLQAQYEQQRERLKEGHPLIKQAEAQLAELNAQITTLASGIRDAIRGQYLVAARQEAALGGDVGRLKGQTLSEQDRSVRYNILKREVDTNRQLYDGLLQRFKELSAQAGIASNNVSVVDKADAPRSPIKPRPMINMALAGVGGLAVALMLVFARERFDDVIRAPIDVEKKLGIPLLGVIPRLKGADTPQVALRDPRSVISEAHYALRTSLELSTGDGIPQLLLLTSSRQAEGKSTTSYAIARDLGLAGRRVLLVDADLRKPSLHRVLELRNEVGLSHLLARQKSLPEAIQPTPVDGLSFLSSGPLPPNPAQLLGSVSLPDLLAELRDAYDVVVIDGPPVLGLADAPRLASVADGTIFVIEANDAHFGNAKAALRRLLSARAQVIGAVLTKFEARNVGYGDEYGYYSYNYGNERR